MADNFTRWRNQYREPKPRAPATPRIIEGVSYYRFRIRYTLTTGERRRMVRWSPGFPWIREEIGRELVERFGLEAIKAGSVTIQSL